MKLSLANVLSGGAFSCVFRQPGENCVYKLFKSSQHDERSKVEPYDNYARAVFQSEVSAYQIAMNSGSLRQYVPEFYDVVAIESITGDTLGYDTQKFLLDCCYKIEFIEGTAVKMADALCINPDIQGILNEFIPSGIQYVRDASVFYPKDLNKMKIIDFAVQDSDNLKP